MVTGLWYDSVAVASEPTSAAPSSTPAQIEHDAFCPECTCNLRGLAEGRCPECGRAFDLASLRVSQIPWSARRQIGRFRAYWRTTWLVIARAGRFSEETVRPVDYADAQRFRWLAIVHVLIFALALTAMGFLLGPEALLMSKFFDWLFASIWLLTTAHVALLLLLAAATGVPSYLFHPKWMPIVAQNRSIALSYYACAPLALMPAAVILLIVSLQVGISLDLFDTGPAPLRIATNALFRDRDHPRGCPAHAVVAGAGGARSSRVARPSGPRACPGRRTARDMAGAPSDRVRRRPADRYVRRPDLRPSGLGSLERFTLDYGGT